MPKLTVRKIEDVPPISRTTKATRDRQAVFEGFIREVPSSGVGELELDAGDNPRGVKVSLRRASSRIGLSIDIWDADGRIYFKLSEAQPKRGRRRRTT